VALVCGVNFWICWFDGGCTRAQNDSWHITFIFGIKWVQWQLIEEQQAQMFSCNFYIYLWRLIKGKLDALSCLLNIHMYWFFHRTSYPKMIPFSFTDWNQSMKLLMGRGVLFADQTFQSSFTLQQKPIIITSAYDLFPKSLNENIDGSWAPVCRSNCSLSRFNQQHKPTFVTDACGFYSSWYLGIKIYVIIKYIES